MEIILNGKPTQIAEHTSAASLLKQLNLTGKRIAVEINQEIVPRGELDQQRLCPGDRIEIVQAIGGG